MTTDINNKRPACYVPWVTRYDWGNGNISPCCEFDPNMKINITENMSLEDSFDHPKMKALRTQLLTCDKNDIDALPSGCNQCKVFEKAGAGSMRQGITQVVEDAERYSSYKFNPDEFKLLWLDYRESNLCNFSCKMCSEDLSSTHAKIRGLYGKTGIIKNPHNLQMYLDRLDEVKYVQFLGGEPVLTDSMYIILKEIRKRNLQHNIDMNITTNGSLLHRNNDNLLELFEGFRNVQIAISIDATGDQHDYWRHKGTWNIVWKNIREIEKWAHSQNGANMKIRTAIAWPNAYAARKTFDIFADKLNNGKVFHQWNLVNIPRGLSLKHLPQDILDDLVIWWENYPVVAEMFKNVISNPSMKELMWAKKDIFKRHDAWHGNSFVEAFPEFEDFYNNIEDM